MLQCRTLLGTSKSGHVVSFRSAIVSSLAVEQHCIYTQL